MKDLRERAELAPKVPNAMTCCRSLANPAKGLGTRKLPSGSRVDSTQ